MWEAWCTTPPAHEILSVQGLTLIKSLSSGCECQVQPLSTMARMRQAPTKDFQRAEPRQEDFGRRFVMSARAARERPSCSVTIPVWLDERLTKRVVTPVMHPSP